MTGKNVKVATVATAPQIMFDTNGKVYGVVPKLIDIFADIFKFNSVTYRKYKSHGNIALNGTRLGVVGSVSIYSKGDPKVGLSVLED
jgi:hypothetical protein